MASTFHHSLVLPSTYSPRFRRVACCLPATQQLSYQPITDLRVAFTAGETGGHIYPAVAIADEVKIQSPNSQILFVGAAKSMESTVVRSSGYDFSVIPSTVLARPLISPKNFFLPYRLIKALIKSFKILEDFEPQIVVGTGGGISVPFCLAAALKGITLVIHEQNAYPGIANWFLSRFANLVFVAFNSTVDSFPKHKCVVSGNPVRFSLKRTISKMEAISHFFPKLEETENSNAKLILVLGGSFGANSINIAILNLYYKMLSENDNLFIIWQTGVESFSEMESLVRDHPHLLLKPFLRSMDLAYAAADLVVSRAGAMTCSELLATGKPAILIPSPNVSEGHQFKNASLMADLASSRIITEDELDSITLETSIEELLGNEKELAAMADRALKGAKPDAAAEIVQQIFSLVNSPQPSTE